MVFPNLTFHGLIVVDGLLSSQLASKILYSIFFFGDHDILSFITVQCILSNQVIFGPFIVSVS